MKILNVIISFCLIFNVIFLRSARANEEACDSFNNSNDIIKCVIKNHPEMQIQKEAVNVSEQEIEVAKLSPNPDFELDGIKNDGPGLSVAAALKFPIELGGKKSARVQIAESEKNLTLINSKKNKNEIIFSTLLDLYRYRQIHTELEQVKESIETFNKITSPYRGGRNLNPEQEISFSAYKLAREVGKLKEASLQNEKEEINLRFQKSIGKSIELTNAILPPLKSKWPTLIAQSIKEIKDIEFEKLNQNVSLFQAKLELEKSASWPDLTFGPKVELKTGPQQETLYGAVVSFPLPLFNLNGAGRRKASSELSQSELSLQLKKQNLEAEMLFLYSFYKKTSSAVSMTILESNINAKHENLHKLMGRGVASSSMIIELHNQIFEYYENLHSLELKTVDALWKIYAFEGRDLEKESL